VAEDITDRKQLEEQFLHAQRMEAIGALASGVAHDLNNILAPILIVAGLLKETAITANDREMLSMIEQSGHRGAGIVRQLLTFSRANVGAERITVQPKHLVHDMTQIMRETFPRNITIVESVPRDLRMVTADPTQLHQVIMNLCVNARDAMSQGGTLTLEGSNVDVGAESPVDPSLPPGAYIRLKVEDTGHGIPPAIIHRIFEPFFTTKDIGKGTGLGLSTAFGIVKSHGGVMHVRSEPGRGTAFLVYLPAAAEPDAVVVTETLPSRGHGHKELILVVDDEASIREALRSLLELQGYRVLTAESGEDAIKACIRHQGAIRLVVTDMMMPGMDGLDLIRALRVLHPSIRIIASSGLDQAMNRAELNSLGVAELVDKPFTPVLILNAVAHALGQ
jgi:nitrogen-specific signal transduction histidine kinase